MIADATGRRFKKLRVSLTHECNYACIYCADGAKVDHAAKKPMPVSLVPENKTLSSSGLIDIITKLHAELQLDAVRFTGGEPLLQPRIISMLTAVRSMGIENIGMTTNGELLHRKAKSLYDSGLKSVNISLDALSPDVFKQMSLHDGLLNVMKAIDASLNAGMTVKLNTVVVAGKNHHQILPLLKFALERGIVIRFLELMPMGPLHHSRNEMFFPSSQILSAIRSEYPIEPLSKDNGATADYWSIGGKKAFGIIANNSSPFCSDCNRLRLDSYGNLYGCLSSLIPIPVTSADSIAEIRSALQLAITHKQPSRFIGNNRTMQSIGG
jgi:GTP 3',8-cyclase